VNSPSRQRLGRWIAIVLVVVVAGGAVASTQLGLLAEQHASPANGAQAPSKAKRLPLGFADGDAAASAAAPAKVPVVAVETRQQSQVLHLTGSLVADDRSELASNVSGMVAEIRVDRGSTVRKGEIVARLDPTDFTNALNEGLGVVNELKARLGLEADNAVFSAEDQPETRLALAAMELAKANFRRASDLLKSNAMSQEDYERASTEYSLAVERHRQALRGARQLYQSYLTAQARVATLRKALADSQIVAPFDGWVVEKCTAVGERVISMGMFQGGKIATLVRIDPLRLSLTVPQQHIGQIKAGQKVTFEIDSYPGQTFTGTVRYITPLVTSDNRSLVVEAVVPNPEAQLRPGLFVTAQLELGPKHAECWVPKTAVQRFGDLARVYVVRDGRAQAQVVSLGETAGEMIHVTSGLQGDQRVVAAPHEVQDGSRIEP